MKIKIRGNWDIKEVWINEKKLSPRRSQQVWNHSPDGFNWGYGGSGPAQLALAILLEYYDKNLAVRKHQQFKDDFVARLPQTDFEREIDLSDWETKGVFQY